MTITKDFDLIRTSHGFDIFARGTLDKTLYHSMLNSMICVTAHIGDKSYRYTVRNGDDNGALDYLKSIKSRRGEEVIVDSPVTIFRHSIEEV